MSRKSPDGVPTNDLILSARTGTNADLFPHVLSLYVPVGAVVADVTYGRGVFWRQVPESAYDLRATDLETGTDCRNLPYDNESIDCVVLDPPYMHSPGGTAHKDHQNFEGYYDNQATTSDLKGHEAVLDLYKAAAQEAWQVLKDKGILIVKCQDEVCSQQQRLTHVEIIDHLENDLGYICEDLFVLVSRNRPGVSRTKGQRHARKNHSYFLVFRKGNGRWPGIDPENRLDVRDDNPIFDLFGDDEECADTW